jgi:Skp family chaperone for outer membrane proteins
LQTAQTTPTKVALVDLQRLTNALDELADRNKTLESIRTDYKGQIDGLENDVKAIEEQLRTTIPDSDRKLKLQKTTELVEKRNLLDFRNKRLKALLEVENAEVIRDLYIKIGNAVGEFAVNNGYDLVLLDDRTIPIPANPGMEEMNNIILNRRVLHANPAIDITDRLITVMNNDYKSGGNKPK